MKFTQAPVGSGGFQSAITGLPANSPLRQNYAAATKTKPDEPVNVDSDGSVWAGPIPKSYLVPDSLLLGYTSIAPVQAFSIQARAPMVILPGWSVDTGVVLAFAGGQMHTAFVRPDLAGPFLKDLINLGKAKMLYGGLPRPLASYGKVAYALLYSGLPPSADGLSQWFQASILG